MTPPASRAGSRQVVRIIGATDVAHSAHRWRLAPDDMRMAIARHDEIVRDALQRHGGVHLRGLHDGLLVSFQSAIASINWSLEVFSALGDIPWPPITDSESASAILHDSPVRIALHAGPAFPRSTSEQVTNELVGVPVHVATSLARAAIGGQIVLSDSVHRLASSEAAAFPTNFEPLGRFHIPGCSETLLVYRVARADSARSTALNLPSTCDPLLGTPPADFIGRSDALAAVQQSLDAGARVVSIHGHPGVGKTHLLRAFIGDANHYGTNSDGGVWAWSLSSSQSPSDVLMTVTRGLGRSCGPGAPSTSRLVGELLAELGPALIALDGTDHVLTDLARFLKDWMSVAPAARFLTTSRRCLRVPLGGHVELAPLDTSAATTLFAKRAGAHKSDFAITRRNEGIIHDIVRRLDGNALAIELAACRLDTLSLTQLQHRLKRPLEVLSHSSSALDQTSFRDLLEDVWQDLSNVEQTVLAQCSVFAGSFSLVSAEQVLDLSNARQSEASALQVLDQLHRHALLKIDTAFDGGRFVLSDVIREFAKEKLEASNQGPALRRRHATHYVAIAETWLEGTMKPDADRADDPRRDIENLRVVETEMRAQVPSLSCRASLALSALFLHDSAYRLALDKATVALSTAQQTGEWRLQVEAVLSLADAQLRTGSPEEALRLCEEARRLTARKPAAKQFRGLASLVQANALRDLGRNEAALTAFRTAARVFRAIGKHAELARTLCNLGMVLTMLGRPRQAHPLLIESIALRRRIGDLRGVAISLGGLSYIYCEQGLFDLARGAAEDALTQHVELGDRAGEALVSCNLGTVLLATDCYQEALGRLLRAIEVARDIGLPAVEATALGNLAVARMLQGRWETAAKPTAEGLEVSQAHQNVRIQAYCLALEGAQLAWARQLRPAKQSFRKSRLLVERTYPQLLKTIDVLEGMIDISRASIAAEAGRQNSARAHRAAAQRRLPENETCLGEDLLLATKLLNFHLGQESSSGPEQRDKGCATADHLHVGQAERWFRPPRGKQVDISRRRSLRALLRVLLDFRLAHPGRVTPNDMLVRSVWPGVKLEPEVASNRVCVAVSTLRQLGLQGILLTDAGGYLLDPLVPVIHEGVRPRQHQ